MNITVVSIQNEAGNYSMNFLMSGCEFTKTITHQLASTLLCESHEAQTVGETICYIFN